MKTKLTSLLLFFSFLWLNIFAESGNPTIYGIMRASDAWKGSSQAGIYSFPATNPTSFTEIFLDKGMTCVTGAYHTDGNYYAITKTSSMIDLYTLQTYQINPVWKKVGYGNVLFETVTLIASDPVSDKLFAISQSNSKNAVLNELDNSGYSPSLMKIGEIPEIYTMSINARGEIVGITPEGKLYKINSADASYELIGMTGLNPKNSESQGTTFNPLSPDKMYWSANLADGTRGLYEIDTRSAYTKLIASYETSEIMIGTFIFPPEFTNGTPDIVKDLNIEFQPAGSLTGKIKFTTPSYTPDGLSLGETIDLNIQINNDSPFSVNNLTPGSNYESEEITFINGYQEIKITASNFAGAGNTAAYSIWAGNDIPAGVSNLLLIENENKEAVITWDTPIGQHGGVLDQAILRYKIIRHIDGEESLLEEAYTVHSYTDTSVAAGKMGSYKYEVIPYIDENFGPSAISNELFMGVAYLVPFMDNFSTRDNFLRWTINNISGEGVVYNWSYDYSNGGQVNSLRKQSGGGSPETSNSWFISPPIKLETGRSYKISYKMTEYGERDHNGKIEVTLGTSLDPVDHTLVLGTHELLGNGIGNLNYETYIQLKSVDEDGIYYLGFHDISTPKGYQLYLDDVSIEYSDLPAAITDLILLAAPDGQLKTFISFKAPTTTIEGLSLTAISKIEIYRNDDEQVFWTNEDAISPGQEFNLSDNTPVNGLNTYRIICSNSSGEGEASEDTVFIGVDIPIEVSNLSLISQDGNAIISWSAPAIGINGGFIDNSFLKYKIIRSDNFVISENESSTTIIDRTVPRDIQDYYYYSITPFNETGEGATSKTKMIRFGDPYEAPFYESFTNAVFTQKTWIAFELAGTSSANWMAVPLTATPETTPQDNDNGFATFTSIRSFPGDSIRMTSPAIDISKLSAPKLSFWMYHIEGNGMVNDRLWVQVSNKNGEYENLTKEAIKVLSPDKNGWTLYEISLDKYLRSDNIILGFVGVSDLTNNINIDNISVTENHVYPTINSLTGNIDNLGLVSLNWENPTVETNETLASILGYNVYRNNQKINQEIIDSNSYTDQLTTNGIYTYMVTVVYETKESDKSNEVTINAAITNISHVDSEIVVYSANNNLIVKGAAGLRLSLYAVDGKIIYDTVLTNEEESISVSKGIYISRVGSKTIKTIAK